MANKKRSVSENAIIGIIGGGIGGVTNAVVTHPIDTLKTLQQQSKGKFKVGLKDYIKAYGQTDKWKGVGSSAMKKGVGFGIGLGATFAAEAQIKKTLAKIRAKQELSKLGFHKTP